jgi:hypothetical protein
MNLYVPGSPPDIGRKRPYTIGDPADVETARRMYPYIIPHHAKTKGESMGFAYRLGHMSPFSITSESSHASCLQC